VKLVHRRDELRAERILQERLFKNPKVELLWDHEVVDYLGTDGPPKVRGVKLRNVKSGDTRDVQLDGVFVAIGHEPQTELVKDQLKMKPSGYVWTAPDSTATSIPGVFAAGDVTDDIYRQAVTAAGMGCMAALEAERFLSHEATVRTKAAAE
jgi:thioredoxin reductase (NADPH)